MGKSEVDALTNMLYGGANRAAIEKMAMAIVENGTPAAAVDKQLAKELLVSQAANSAYVAYQQLLKNASLDRRGNPTVKAGRLDEIFRKNLAKTFQLKETTFKNLLDKDEPNLVAKVIAYTPMENPLAAEIDKDAAKRKKAGKKQTPEKPFETPRKQTFETPAKEFPDKKPKKQTPSSAKDELPLERQLEQAMAARRTQVAGTPSPDPQQEAAAAAKAQRQQKAKQRKEQRTQQAVDAALRDLVGQVEAAAEAKPATEIPKKDPAPTTPAKPPASDIPLAQALRLSPAGTSNAEDLLEQKLQERRDSARYRSARLVAEQNNYPHDMLEVMQAHDDLHKSVPEDQRAALTDAALSKISDVHEALLSNDSDGLSAEQVNNGALMTFTHLHNKGTVDADTPGRLQRNIDEHTARATTEKVKAARAALRDAYARRFAEKGLRVEGIHPTTGHNVTTHEELQSRLDYANAALAKQTQEMAGQSQKILEMDQKIDLLEQLSRRSRNSPPTQMDAANDLRQSISRLTAAVDDIDGMRRLTRTTLPATDAEAKDKIEAGLQADPMVQRMLDAGVISLKDIVKGNTIPLLEDPATRKVVQNRLDQLEQRAQAKLQPMAKEYAERQTKAFERTIPNTNLKLYVPPRYAPAGTPAAKRQRPKTVGAMIGFPTGAYYT